MADKHRLRFFGVVVACGLFVAPARAVPYQITQLTHDNVNNFGGGISGSNVVWISNDNNVKEVYLYDG